MKILSSTLAVFFTNHIAITYLMYFSHVCSLSSLQSISLATISRTDCFAQRIIISYTGVREIILVLYDYLATHL